MARRIRDRKKMMSKATVHAANIVIAQSSVESAAADAGPLCSDRRANAGVAAGTGVGAGTGAGVGATLHLPGAYVFAF